VSARMTRRGRTERKAIRDFIFIDRHPPENRIRIGE